jgi:Domain of unknown function (DUF5069)
MLFTFKGITSADFKAYVGQGHSDEAIAQWVQDHGITRSPEETNAWSGAFKTDFSYSTNPDKKEWFTGECVRLGLDPAKTTLFDYLEVDDRASFKTA